MYRFFVTEKKGDYFFLDEQILKHIKVLRIKKDETFLCIYQKKVFECILEKDNARIIKIHKDINNEFKEEIILAVALLKNKKMELVIQKATELGVTKIIPIVSKNISVKFETEKFNKKMKRWKEIAKHAAQQSFRNIIPEIEKPKKFNQIIKMKIKNKFLLHEKSKKIFKDLFPQQSLFIIGPEGGFDKSEITLAKKNAVNVLSLGRRILRSETACFFVLSRIIQN